jgi:hypothetical protein
MALGSLVNALRNLGKEDKFYNLEEARSKGAAKGNS